MSKTDKTSFYKEIENVPFKLRVLRWYIKVLSYIWPSKAVDLLVSLFTRPRVDREAILKRYNDLGLFSKGIEDTIEFQGESIFVYQEGEAEVLLVTGWESSAHRMVTLMELLREKEIGFVYFDLPAHGKSGGSKNDAVKSAKLISYLCQIYPGISTIIGHSFGGGAAYLAIQEGEEFSNGTKNISRLITIGSPTRYQSVIDPFLVFLDVPDHMEDEFIDGLSRYVGRDFREYDWENLQHRDGVEVKVFHDKNDKTIPVKDAERLNGKFSVNITQELGHRKIMHDRKTLLEIIDQIQ